MTSEEVLERLFGSYVASKCYCFNYQQDDEDYETIKKALKAFEIIKEKRVDVRAFLKSCYRIDDGLLMYNNQCDNENVFESKELTQEEYDLLKEVLL